VKFSVFPCTVKAAKARVKAWHRHLEDIQGGLFAAQCLDGSGACVGVAVAGNPARVWQGQAKLVISRVAAVEGLPRVTDSDGADHAAPACTMLYGALCRAAKALGYREVWTYTLPHETGRSLKAAGFIDMGLSAGGEHDRPSRPRKAAKHPERKRRWLRILQPQVTK
jgi:hypothetical protein